MRTPILDELELAWRASRAPLVAITGTNGKSTTAQLCRPVVAAATGGAVALAGNTEFGPALSAVAGVDGWVVCEVSSFQLAGSPALLPEIAVVTNLSEEHIPWHGDLRAYAAAKRRLVIREHDTAPVAVLNADDDFCRELAGEARNRGSRVLRYGFSSDAEVRIEEASWDMRSAHLELRTPDGPLTVDTLMPGAHNALNVAAAAAVGHALSLPAERIAAAVAGVAPPPGRWQAIDAGQSFTVLVDYAHTPDGVSQALTAARAGMRSDDAARLRVVIGPVGLDDRSKARGIAGAAAALSDHVVLTTGSAPRAHRLMRIAEMLAATRECGGARVEVVLERRSAIAHALRSAGEHDAVLILGIGALGRLALDPAGTVVPFDDREAAHELLGELVAGAQPAERRRLRRRSNGASIETASW
jgi:UDP-N-acetylmuramoyl-L-alanyl-D-glutamate--2,6-diaminopimelate ligase